MARGQLKRAVHTARSTMEQVRGARSEFAAQRTLNLEECQVTNSRTGAVRARDWIMRQILDEAPEPLMEGLERGPRAGGYG